MVDFANIRAYTPTNDAKPYLIPEIETPGDLGFITLYCRSATEANSDYHNEWLRRVAERQKQPSRKTQVDGDLLRESRDEDRELIALKCLTGWENVVDAKGQAVEFSPENAHDFLKALPDWLFDRFRTWIMNPRSFVNVTPADGTALGN